MTIISVARSAGRMLLRVLLVAAVVAGAAAADDDTPDDMHVVVCVPAHLPPIRTKPAPPPPNTTLATVADTDRCKISDEVVGVPYMQQQRVQPSQAATTLTAAPVPSTAAAAATRAPVAVFSPYVESWTDQALEKIPGTSVTLAFLLSKGGRPVWDGSMDLDKMLPRVKASGGKKIVLSFGGATGTELALDVKDPAELARQYVLAAKRYSASRLDLDIEGGTLSNTAAITRRNAALKIVNRKLPGVKIQYTLPVMPAGLDAACLALLKDAKKQGVELDAVNVMAMDYGESFTGDMGLYAIQAAQATRRQLQELGMDDVGVGITPMILVNDVKAEVFTLEDARQVADFAAKTPWVKFVGYWATGRDPGLKFARVFASKLT